MQLISVKIEKPDDTNFILGQTHFIKSVEDIHEALVAAVPGIKFGLAFCEASGKCLVRWSRTDPRLLSSPRPESLPDFWVIRAQAVRQERVARCLCQRLDNGIRSVEASRHGMA